MLGNQEVVLRESASDNQGNILRAVLGSTNYGFMLTDLDHVTIACNAEFGRLFGVNIRDVVRNNVVVVRKMVRDRIVELENWEKNLESVYADPFKVQLDELQLKNPKARLRRWTGPVLSEEGKSTGRLWTFLDITEEARLRAMRETLAEVATYYHPDPSEVCRYLVELVGKHYGSISILSVRVADFMQFFAVGGPESPAKHMAGNRLEESYCQFCLEANEPFMVQDARKQKEFGHVLPAKLGLTRYAGVPLRAPNGEAIGTLCFFDDRSDEPLDREDLRFLELIALRISGEMDRELRVLALRDDLHARDESLRRAQHRLIESEKLAITGLFSAAIAHDIRNILSAVSVDISLYNDRPDEGLAMVRQHLSRFDVLSRRLLSYARPAEIALEEVNLAELIERVLALLEGHLALSGVKTQVQVSDSLPRIQADPIRLEHLFVNLLMNALQAMGNGGQITITNQREGDWLRVEVADTGKGIPPARLSRIFEAFSSTRRDGFGLGLYSCQQIMQEVGGTISVASEPGKGTTFKMLFPANA
jgi:signal transduction histidine kinase